MSTLHLIVGSSSTKPGVRVSVDDALLIGDYVDTLVAELGYPQKDSTGSPVVYQLRVISQERPLPNTRRFAEVGVASGTHLVLESEAASYTTRPMAYPVHHLWSRRSALLVLAFAVTGLGAGFSVALAQRRSKSQSRTVSGPPALQTTPSTLVPRAATPRLTFTNHRQTVRALGWSPDGQLLASGGDDGLLLVWEVNGMVQRRFVYTAPITALAWSPESQRIVTGAANLVTFLSVRTGTILAHRLQPHTKAVTALGWTGHNQWQAVSGALDRKAVVWRTTDYTPQTIFTKHAAPIEGVSWAADGQTIASCSQGGVIRVWDAASGQETHALFQDGQMPLRALAFAPTSGLLAVGADDGIARLWENGLHCHTSVMENGALVCQDAPLRLRGLQSSAIRSVAWSPDGRFFASGDNGGVCTLWNLERLQPLFSFTVASGLPIHGLSWSPTGDQLAIAAGNTVVIWSLRPSQAATS